jgi:hypothetical protein
MCICGKSDCQIPYGLCHCGCGRTVAIVRVTDRPKQRVAGTPSRFIQGHAARHLRPIIEQPSDTSIRHIPLTRGLITVVDAEDFDWLNKWPWGAVGDMQGGCYAGRCRTVADGPGVSIILMHRFLLGLDGTDEDDEGDHRDGDRLNNRRSNLRPGPHAKNQMNRGRSKNNLSGITGVGYHKGRGRYRARIRVNGKEILLGYTTTIAAAASLRRAGEEKYFGEWRRK